MEVVQRLLPRIGGHIISPFRGQLIQRCTLMTVLALLYVISIERGNKQTKMWQKIIINYHK